jgi:hypothetical protein
MGSFLSNWTVPAFLRARTLVPPIQRVYTTCPQVGAAIERRMVGRPKVRKTHACPEEEVVVVVTTRRIDGAKPGPGEDGGCCCILDRITLAAPLGCWCGCCRDSSDDPLVTGVVPGRTTDDDRDTDVEPSMYVMVVSLTVSTLPSSCWLVRIRVDKDCCCCE